MDLEGLKVKIITYPHGEYRLGMSVKITVEGSFYLLDGMHIFDIHMVRFYESFNNINL